MSLGVRVECLDCRMALSEGSIWNPSNVTSGGWLWGQPLVDGQEDSSDAASFAATTSLSDNNVVGTMKPARTYAIIILFTCSMCHSRHEAQHVTILLQLQYECKGCMFRPLGM